MKRKFSSRFGLSVVVLMVVMFAGSPAPVGAQAMTERMSVDSAGVGGNGYSDYPKMSADGRYVAFFSYATNLVPGDTNGNNDIFVHDRQTGVTERVSVSSTGVEANANSTSPSISEHGRYVAFLSIATNLVSGDTNGVQDAFLHDRKTGFTFRMSVDSFGAEANGHTFWADVSADGGYVAFESAAENLDPIDANGFVDIFVRDVASGTTELVSKSTGGIQGFQNSNYPSISADGRYVAFSSFANTLVPGDTNNYADIFVHDRQTGVTTRVSVSSGGAESNNGSFRPSISDNGRYVAFDSAANNLVPGDTNGRQDVFVHDRQMGVTERSSLSSGGFQGNGASSWGRPSADGRFVSFYSNATNLVPLDTNSVVDVFVHDRQTLVTERVSVDSNGVQLSASSDWNSISGDGRYAAFSSVSAEVVPGDTNGTWDVFARLAQTVGVPVLGAANYDTDPEADIGVFRPSTGDWYIQGSPAVRWGTQKGVIP